MKIEIQVTDRTNNLPGSRLIDYWLDHDEDFFPYSLGEQKQNMKRVIKSYCSNSKQELKVTSVFPAVLEAVSECIKEKLIPPENVKVIVFRGRNSYGHSISIYKYGEDGDLVGEYKLKDLVNWMLH